MSYFGVLYDSVRFPRDAADKPGLRRGQLGALHAIASHFTVSDEPALIAMPTGSGKTAVFIIAPFLLRSSRVLVITPSRLVRYQVAEQFGTLEIPKASGALVGVEALPKTHEVDHQLREAADWEPLRSFDVVVSTPNSACPGGKIEGAPSDLFDLVIFDEAHHVPAPTWQAISKAFPEARKLLLTATPFRRDRREIPAKLIYHYSIRQALDDGVFGRIEYVPIRDSKETNDIAVARAAETILKTDREAGMQHLLLVRTDTTSRAKELGKLYQAQTGLKLARIGSDLSYTTIKKTIARLRERKLDGIICVDMLGEGFDLPELKVAAIHAPHKTLGVTLQFIGRFARTSPVQIGTAKFIAVPSDITFDASRLYEEDADWQALVPRLIEERVVTEVETRQALETFVSRVDSIRIAQHLSLYRVRPYLHVKVFDIIEGDVRLPVEPPEMIEEMNVISWRDSPELSATLIIFEVVTPAGWTDVEELSTVEYEFALVFYDVKTRLLFISSSVRSPAFYDALIHLFVDGRTSILSMSEINRAFLGLTHHQFFHIGMKTRMRTSWNESYRTLSGRHVDRTVRGADARTHDRGHYFGRAKDGDTDVTLGISSSSKAWSNRKVSLPFVVSWSHDLAAKIRTNVDVQTGTRLDLLSMTRRVSAIPDVPVVAIDWERDAYEDPMTLRVLRDGETFWFGQLLDCDFLIDKSRSTNDSIVVLLQFPLGTIAFRFSLKAETYFEEIDVVDALVERPGGAALLVTYLNGNPPSFYFADFSRLTGNMYSAPTGADFNVFSPERIETVDWTEENVDITCEAGAASGGRRSVQDLVSGRLSGSTASIVIFDHRTGELADFIEVTQDERVTTIGFYHCKGSSEEVPGARVEDVYEVCAQVVKSLIWMTDVTRLCRNLERRIANGSSFLRGGRDQLREILTRAAEQPLTYQVTVVQPGVSASRLPPKMQEVLGAADLYLAAAGWLPLRVIASA
ncbi:MAG TPA: DEAD/DEAH box helicase family protein [Thermoanaerobaculia bacterium]|nr:DEAD/DEAH box helicase family protein [Thermoanaerobaculia bacterium]